MIISSIIDNDFYKFTMQNAVIKLFPRAKAKYKFIDRSKIQYPKGFDIRLKEEIQNFRGLKLTMDEKQFLLENCEYLDPTYIDFLHGYRYNPDEVVVTLSELGDLSVEISGYWYRTILWEVPLLALISELYYKIKNLKIESEDLFIEKLSRKKDIFISSEAKVADFGTRRRFSFENQRAVVEYLSNYKDSCFSGTSNVFFAYTYGVKVIGTHAHEWFMFHSAKYGYKMANVLALENWSKIYHGDLGIALSDTFTSDVFFRAFNMKYAKLFDGVRHDSGDPIVFAKKTIQHYRNNEVDPYSKTIVFSDGLDANKVKEICEFCKNKIKVSFGIGTNLTNDVGVKPLNIVIKMTDAKPYSHDWVPVVKISDVTGKYSGDIKQINLCKAVLNITD